MRSTKCSRSLTRVTRASRRSLPAIRRAARTPAYPPPRTRMFFSEAVTSEFRGIGELLRPEDEVALRPVTSTAERSRGRAALVRAALLRAVGLLRGRGGVLGVRRVDRAGCAVVARGRADVLTATRAAVATVGRRGRVVPAAGQRAR